MAMIWAFFSVIVLVYLLQQLLGPRRNKGLPPGPIGLPILGHLHLLGENPHHALCDLARKHGPIMGLRFGFVPAVIVSSPAAAELVLKTHDLVFAGRPRTEVGKCIFYDQRDIVFGSYGPYWRDMRKLCTMHLLSNFKIAQFEPMRRAELGLLVSSLKRAAEGGETVDLSALISAVNGDMNCLLVFGKKYSDLKQKGFKDVIVEAMELGATFNFADYFPYVGVLDLQGLHRRMKRVSNIFDEILERIIDDHLHNKQEKKQAAADIVDTMMAIMESGEAGFDFDRRHVKAVLLDMLIAGMDTASTAIEWAMSELMRHPAAMKDLQQELESTVGLDKMVEESHLDKLEYLDCVVKETMRLHPVAPLLVNESTEDCVLDGFHIRKGFRVMVNVWAIGRDPDVWAYPETFTPERFIGSDIDLRGRHLELIPFGSGRRGCPGLQLGLTVVKLVVAQLVHCFDWELPNGIIKKPHLSVHEFDQVEAAYAVEDRSWKSVIRGRIVSAMGRFRLSGNKEKSKEKVKAAARSTKGQEQPSKRKEVGSSSLPDSPVRAKKAKASADDSAKRSVPSSMVVEASVDKGKGIVGAIDTIRPGSSPIRLPAFFEEIKKSFSRSLPARSGEGSPDLEQKLHLTFDKTAAVLYAQYEMLNDLEDVRGPMKEKLLQLSHQLSETESELEVVTRMSKRKDDTIARLEKLKGDADTVIDALKTDLDEMEKMKNAEIEGLRGRIEQLSEDNELLKRGEGLDFEALVDLPGFDSIKECIEDSTGEELIRQINEVHPEWDLSFLNADAGPPADRGQKGGDGANPPNADGDQAAPDSTTEGGPA